MHVSLVSSLPSSFKLTLNILSSLFPWSGCYMPRIKLDGIQVNKRTNKQTVVFRVNHMPNDANLVHLLFFSYRCHLLKILVHAPFTDPFPMLRILHLSNPIFCINPWQYVCFWVSLPLSYHMPPKICPFRAGTGTELTRSEPAKLRAFQIQPSRQRDLSCFPNMPAPPLCLCASPLAWT